MNKRQILDALPNLIHNKYPGRRSQIATIAEGFGIEVKESWGKERIFEEMLKSPACLLEIFTEYLEPEPKKFIDIISPRHSVNIRAQHHLSVEKREEFAKIIVTERLKNMRRFILRAIRDGNIEQNRELLFEISLIQRKLEKIQDIKSIRGLEGAAYSKYRKILHSMVKYSFPYDGMRSPSPFVAMLRFVEAELIELSKKICWEAGLDPYVGTYHFSHKWGFPGLAYDLIHPYTPRIVDAVVISAINRQRIVLKDFERWDANLSSHIKEILRDTFTHALNRKIIYRLDWLEEQDRVSYQDALKRQAACFADYILDRREFQVFILK